MIDFIFDVLGDLLALLPWSKRRRERRKEWSGTVEAKKTWTLSKHAYLVIFRTDDGQRKKVRLDRQEDFDLYEEGRRYTKKTGEDLPDTKPAN
ncbi:MAG: hypothetical protein A2V45_16655 [Candidatus Aminicenantes bacterium RBG_19FT_COMBO_58_17]|nr:MAG: hypothetical protein A2V45_16655 [Candidatus Aminicenantes bacterium RBG_19FT_COMBO_58_17]